MSRKVYDLNRLRKTYPLRRKRPDFAVIDDSLTENVILTFGDNAPFPHVYSFDNTYQAVPVCIITPENVRVNAFIESINLTEVTINISGSIPAGQNLKIHLQIFKNQDVSS